MLSRDYIETLDANIIIRVITQDNSAHFKRAIKLIQRKNTLFILHELTVAEVVYVLSSDKIYAYPREEIKNSILDILNFENISCNISLIEDALNLYVEHPSLSYTDCFLAVFAAANQSEPLWTFDQTLARLPAAKAP